MNQQILIAHDLVGVPPASATTPAPMPAPLSHLATVLSNLTCFGFALSAEALDALRGCDDDDLTRWWGEVEPVLSHATGADREMEEFIVYRNFPAEVLAMDEAEYWFRQILMYWGLPNKWVTTPAQERPALAATTRPRVLHLADAGSLDRILAGLLAAPARWVDQQWGEVSTLLANSDDVVDLTAVPFGENRVRLAAWLLEHGRAASVGTATDVLRLTVALSEGDVSLRTPCRLRALRRAERRFLLGLLDEAANLDEDIARHPEQFKRLLRALRPGDYRTRFPRVVAAYDRLYRGEPVPRFGSDLERLLAANDPAALDLLRTRPGEFARRLHATVLLFGGAATDAFAKVLPDLTTMQLVRLHRYLHTVDTHRWRTFPPRGDWRKMQIVENDSRRRLPADARDRLLAAIGGQIGERMSTLGPVALAPEADWVKLPTNDGDLSPYGRGTVFPLPDNVTFVRTASYWRSGPTTGSIWYDNGWSFFGPDWTPMGACCWDHPAFHGAAVFSGDPTNSKDPQGRACQAIDLLVDELATHGVAFAVWSVLAYSHLPFSSAEEVFGTLHWGDDADAGEILDPSRCQLAFELTGDHLTTFVACLDVRARQLIYLDAHLGARVESAGANGEILRHSVPAYLEYLDRLPSVRDLFAHSATAPDGLPVRYDDRDVRIDGGPAYVFRPANEKNAFDPLEISLLLGRSVG